MRVKDSEDGVNVAPIDEFAEALLVRVADARIRLADAAATADSHAVAEALDELEEALGLARESGINVPQHDGTER